MAENDGPPTTKVEASVGQREVPIEQADVAATPLETPEPLSDRRPVGTEVFNAAADNAPMEEAADTSRCLSIPESVEEADLIPAEAAPVRANPVDASAATPAIAAERCPMRLLLLLHRKW